MWPCPPQSLTFIMSVLLKILCLVCLNLCSGFVQSSLKCSTAFFSLLIISCAVVSAKTSSLILGLAFYFSLFQGSLWALCWDLSIWMLSLQSWLHKCFLAVFLGIECTAVQVLRVYCSTRNEEKNPKTSFSPQEKHSRPELAAEEHAAHSWG